MDTQLLAKDSDLPYTGMFLCLFARTISTASPSATLEPTFAKAAIDSAEAHAERNIEVQK